MAWFKREVVDKNVVKLIEYRYLNDKGFIVDASKATKCRVTEYDVDGNIVNNTVKLCMPLSRYYGRFIIWLVVVLFLSETLYMLSWTRMWLNVDPALWFLTEATIPIFRFLNSYIYHILYLSYFFIMTYVYYRMVIFKESYLALSSKDEAFTFFITYLISIAFIGAYLFKLHWCLNVMPYILLAFIISIFLPQLYKKAFKLWE